MFSLNKPLAWSDEKNEVLIKERGIGFEQVREKIINGDIVDVIDHPNQKDYSHQKILLINFDDYIYAVPYVEDKQHIFLKTIFPTRKLTKQKLKR
ncbi:DUF4258 domain-containing protein [Thiotrichales bacterium 19S3-7]|nr:DUF4258 domain-containing protein [Thiotrichales bacterium 19S3-7]MCF6775701.1 DUF4258 domain-containing protein [Thiotrichales bacterium 19X7-9]MCF6803057.1 DUF4258 domain-containing protein [Thiotrichales bacterium 19S3-11]